MDERAEKTISVAEEISALLHELGVKHAVIGAMALAVHGYQRATLDFDIATSVDPFSQLIDIENQIKKRGFRTELITPDAEDPLGGVLTIERDDIDPIQLVNFYNPLAPGAGTIGQEAIKESDIAKGGRLAVVDLPHLIALKLYAGGLQSKADAVQLLKVNPQANIQKLRDITSKHNLLKELEEVLQEI